ncbi:MAG: FGGY family carbohydrate kinase [Anaerolineaceae bacterium]|jgi:xylulokinase|nr:FGGY family carbohydrate kinase [Anaerolineaceae bacterium]
MQDLILSLDVGTTVVKCVLIDTQGQEHGVVEYHCGQISLPNGVVEQDPQELWRLTVATLRESQSRVQSNQTIRGIVLSTQGGSVIPVDENYIPTNHMITWLDSRAQGIVQEWNADGTSQKVRQISGWSPQAGLPFSVIAWFQRHAADIFAKTRYWLPVNAFLNYRLTGFSSTNPSMAAEMLLTDIRTCEWNQELCDLVGIQMDQLPPIFASTAMVGGLTQQVSQQTNLPAGLPVFQGGQDHSAEALALGVTGSDQGFLACGTAWVINAVTRHGNVDQIPAQMDLNFHVIPEHWIASQFLGGFGAYPEWMLKQFWEGQAAVQRENRYSAMNQALSEHTRLDPGLLFLPLNGSAFARNAPPGGGFTGLRLDHQSVDLTRAVLETSAFEVRWALESLKQDGTSIQQLWMIGGAARSPVWPQIIADVNGVSVLLTTYSHGPAMGAAMLACLGLGIYGSVEECSQHFHIHKKEVQPDLSRADFYQQKFEKYQRTIQEVNW